jgi:hypothetical protein
MQLLLDRLAAMALLDGCCAHHLDELLLDGQDKGRVKERAQVCSRTCIVPEKQKRAAEPRGRKERYSQNRQQLRAYLRLTKRSQLGGGQNAGQHASATTADLQANCNLQAVPPRKKQHPTQKLPYYVIQGGESPQLRLNCPTTAHVAQHSGDKTSRSVCRPEVSTTSTKVQIL